MNKNLIVLTILLLVASGFNKQGANDISKNLDLIVFPSQDQDADQQELDEYKCFKWAKENTGYDPLNPPDIKAQPAQTGPDGTAIRSTGGGAAAGAAIGAIAGDAGKGAAIGATVGAFRTVRTKQQQAYSAEAQAQQSVQQQQAALMDKFKRAFSACMESKGYMVK